MQVSWSVPCSFLPILMNPCLQKQPSRQTAAQISWPLEPARYWAQLVSPQPEPQSSQTSFSRLHWRSNSFTSLSATKLAARDCPTRTEMTIRDVVNSFIFQVVCRLYWSIDRLVSLQSNQSTHFIPVGISADGWLWEKPSKWIWLAVGELWGETKCEWSPYR